MRRRLVITIDGPSGTGKSTAARELARKLRYLYLDTGALYRAVALEAIRRKVPLGDAEALTRMAGHCRISFRSSRAGGQRVYLNGAEVTRQIRQPRVAEAASRVAAVPGVRRALLRQQRAMGRRGGLVAEGRDTGTVVFPRADLKVYLTASAGERARRRHEDLQRAGVGVPLREVARQVRERDRRDLGRKASPLRPARGCVRVDNTRLKSTDVLAKLIDYVRGAQKGANHHGRTVKAV